MSASDPDRKKFNDSKGDLLVELLHTCPRVKSHRRNTPGKARSLKSKANILGAPPSPRSTGPHQQREAIALPSVADTERDREKETEKETEKDKEQKDEKEKQKGLAEAHSPQQSSSSSEKDEAQGDETKVGATCVTTF